MAGRIATVARAALAVLCTCSVAVLATRVQEDTPDEEDQRISWWLVGLEFTALSLWFFTEVFKWTSLRLVVAGLLGAGLSLQVTVGASSDSLARACHYALVVGNSCFVALVGFKKRAVWPEQGNAVESQPPTAPNSARVDYEREGDGMGLRVAPLSDLDPDMLSSASLRPGSVISESSEDTVNVSEAVTCCHCDCNCFSPLRLGQIFGVLGLLVALVGILSSAAGWTKICEDLQKCGDDYLVPLWTAIVVMFFLLLAYVWAVFLRRTRDILPLYTIYLAVPVALGVRFANLARAWHAESPHSHYVTGAVGCSLLVVGGYFLLLALAIPSCAWEVPSSIKTRGLRAIVSIGTIVAMSATLVGLKEVDGKICSGTWVNVFCDRMRVVWVEIFYEPLILIMGLATVFAEPGLETRAALILLPIVSLSAYPASASKFIGYWRHGLIMTNGDSMGDSSLGFTATCYGMMCVANLSWLYLWGWEVPAGDDIPEPEKTKPKSRETVLSELYDSDEEATNVNNSPAVQESMRSTPGANRIGSEIQIEMSNMV